MDYKKIKNLVYTKYFLKGFSLIELLISLIVISCITAAFTPVITKKLKTSAVALNAANSEITTECAAKFSSSCKLCTKSYCIQCELSSCAIGSYKENKTCTCKDCATLFPNCVECDSIKCTKCLQTHYIKEGKCEICPTDKICDGINAHDQSYCSNPSDGYFCEGTTLKKCTDKYPSNCTTCNSTQCTGCTAYNYLSSDGVCKSCVLNACYKCRDENYCTMCQGDWILNQSTHRCEKPCYQEISNCLYCSSNASNEVKCTSCYGGYYLNGPKECKSCSEAISNCIACNNATTCTKCKKGFYVNLSNQCRQCTIANCAQCDKDETCLACNQDYHLSPDRKSCIYNDNKFNCSDSNFMQIGNLCVTRKNMGDSTMLPIPSTVNIAQVGNDYCYAQSQKCCWKGNTAASGHCNSENGGYDGCTRTVCSYDAAKEICSKFNYGGKTWRLPTSAEMKNWAYNSIGLKENGLMLCDNYNGYSSAYCSPNWVCKGAYSNGCYGYLAWSGTLYDALNGFEHHLTASVGSGGSYSFLGAFSVRCVTEME